MLNYQRVSSNVLRFGIFALLNLRYFIYFMDIKNLAHMKYSKNRHLPLYLPAFTLSHGFICKYSSSSVTGSIIYKVSVSSRLWCRESWNTWCKENAVVSTKPTLPRNNETWNILGACHGPNDPLIMQQELIIPKELAPIPTVFKAFVSSM